MSWIYEQKTGRLLSPMGGMMATGYSGAGAAKNSPDEENIRDEGPIPEGLYDIEAPIDSPLHGPFALPLLPSVDNVMFGRSAFYCHGDSLTHPGEASEGCIIMPRFARQAIWSSSDHVLQVVREVPSKT